jgi:hypothetical protein
VKSKPEQAILGCVIPRIWQPNSTDTAELGLEIQDGPYKGVVFGFTKFSIDEEQGPDNMVPCHFETTIYSAPEGFKADEAFDVFTAEVLVAWLSYIVGEAPKGD